MASSFLGTWLQVSAICDSPNPVVNFAQALALNAVAAGRHTVVCTATASGKSLCYNLPVLEGLAAHPGATALYLFPTKALAQDQLRVLRELCAVAFGADAPGVEVGQCKSVLRTHQGACK